MILPLASIPKALVPLVTITVVYSLAIITLDYLLCRCSLFITLSLLVAAAAEVVFQFGC